MKLIVMRTSLRFSLVIGSLAGVVLMQACTRPATDFGASSSDSVDSGREIFFTTEPGRNQKTLNKGMNAFADYLTKEIGVRFTYKPAISYLHAYQLFSSGEIDMIRVGIYGGYKVLEQNSDASTLAIQKPSYVSVLIGNQKLRPKADQQNDKGIQVIKGKRVGFGSLYSGSTFMHPLLDMRSQGVVIADTEDCKHVTNQYDLPAMVAVGQLDYAFIKGNSVSLLGRVKDEYLPSIYVAWKSPEVKRNNYFIVSERLRREDDGRLERSLQKAIIDLDRENKTDQVVLDGLSKGALGFEPQNEVFPTPVNDKIKALIQDYGSAPSCED